MVDCRHQGARKDRTGINLLGGHKATVTFTRTVAYA
jgi:hypothetical protein